MTDIKIDIPIPALNDDGQVVLPNGHLMSQEAFAAAWKKLADPFPVDWIEKRAQSKGGPVLDYVGHAGIVMRLNEVDPGWYWEPMSTTPQGEPFIGQFGMWGKLYVLGYEKTGFGDAGRNEGTANGVKEIIGDFLRNAAMRYGVGVYLWSKSNHAAELKKGPQAPPTPSQRASAEAERSGLFSSFEEYKEFAVEAAQTDKVNELTEEEAQNIINAINQKKATA